ncbi:hypothetical protein SAMN05428988_3223 [Chitinophaga sp. YR573]|uniref:hypothetical protein n=1 Tax=Chitinophaga sp. YR573 TaxID=1881040 RepID=UPI0008CE48D2|nr:hypothetical protein [Chitinophaga sp. YR573]SEW21552.1 hypothetical protein SAMN05428988_3223 [Chitinophaga sp. YR573]
MTLRQIVSDLRSMLKQVSADSVLTDRMLASELRSAAALLIRRDLLLRRLWNTPTLFTQIRCLKLCEVPVAECCNYSAPCTIRRSQCRIKGIADLGTFGLAIQGIFTIDGRKKFKEANPSRYENILRLNIPNKKGYYWLLDGYLYITDPDLEAINLVAYFEEGVTFEGTDCQCADATVDQSCLNPLDEDFKCPQYLIENAKNAVYEKLGRLFKSSLADPVSNEKEEAR